MKVRKGNILINKYDTCYIELSRNYSVLAEFLANPIQPDKPTSTDSQFRIRAAKQLQKKTIKN